MVGTGRARPEGGHPGRAACPCLDLRGRGFRHHRDSRRDHRLLPDVLGCRPGERPDQSRHPGRRSGERRVLDESLARRAALRGHLVRRGACRRLFQRLPPRACPEGAMHTGDDRRVGSDARGHAEAGARFSETILGAVPNHCGAGCRIDPVGLGWIRILGAGRGQPAWGDRAGPDRLAGVPVAPAAALPPGHRRRNAPFRDLGRDGKLSRLGLYLVRLDSCRPLAGSARVGAVQDQQQLGADDLHRAAEPDLSHLVHHVLSTAR